MTIRDCIDSAVDGGELTPQEGDELKALYDDFNRQARLEMGDEDAAQVAKQATVERLEAEALHRRRQALLTLRASERIKQDLQAHINSRGEVDPAQALIFHLEHFGNAKFSSVEGRRKAILGRAHAQMEELLFEFRRTAVSGRTRNKARLENVVREAFGEGSGDEAAGALARSWAETAEGLRQRFNRAGGAINRREDWGLPQMHDARALRKAGLEAWKARIAPLLDPARMTHPLTGRPVAGGELDNVLEHVWHSIVMDGWNTRSPSRQPRGRGSISSQRTDHRFLVFKDADSWLSYQRDFGEGDPFAAMMHHLNMMARDIAALEVLGPNPQATLLWMQQIVEQQATARSAGREATFPTRHPTTGRKITARSALDYAKGAIARSNAMWAHMRGSVEAPTNTLIADWLDAASNVVVSSSLGAASLTAISDLAFQQATRMFAGLPAARVLPDLVKQFGRSNRREAVRAGLILDSAVNVMHKQARYVGSLAGPQWSRVLADRVLTWSGLTPWTQAGRHAFGMAFEATLADHVGLRLSELPTPLREAFGRYGISEADWNIMRQAGLYEPQAGARFLRPSEIAELADGPALERIAKPLGIDEADEATRRQLAREGLERIAERYLEMIQSEMEFAVPSGSVRGRSILVGNQARGTLGGSVSRSFAMFKSFSVAMMLLHAQRVFWDVAGGKAARGAVYGGGLVIGSTLLGGLALQLKDISKGRDPRPMDTADFWGAALLQGGGLGIYGDFFFGELNRFGKGFETTLAGPLFGRLNNLWNLTGGNLVQFAGGEKTNVGRETVQFLRQNTPGGSIWYARLAYERVLLDQLQWLIDPDASRAFRRKEKFFRRQFDQDFYFRPGQLTPDRGPQIERALGR